MKKVVSATSWLNREEYPWESNFQKVKHGRLHYVDVGRGQPIVMVHGWPTWSFVYRNLIKELSSNYRCIAVDHLGFGLSDKPRNFSYKPEMHAENLDTFIQELGLRNIILVVHEYGGPIGLSYAIHKPHNVSRIILMNTWMWSRKGDIELEKANRFLNMRVGRFLFEKMNFATAHMLKQAVSNPASLPKQILSHYTSVFPTAVSRKSTMVMVKEMINSADWFENLWRAREMIADIPTLLLWGMEDVFTEAGALDLWHQTFNKQRMIRLAGCGNLIQEEQPTQVPRIIRDFLRDMDTEGL